MPGNDTEIREVLRATKELIAKIRDPLRKKLKKNGGLMLAKDLVHLNIGELILRVAGADGAVTNEEARVYLAIERHLRPSTFAGWTVDTTVDYMNSLLREDSYSGGLEKPFTLELMEQCDSEAGSNYAEEVRDVFFKVASLTARADGIITAEEEAFLKALIAKMNTKRPIFDGALRENTIPSAWRSELYAVRDELHVLVQTASSDVTRFLKHATIVGPTGEPQEIESLESQLKIDVFYLLAVLAKRRGRTSDRDAAVLYAFTIETSKLGDAIPTAIIDAMKPHIESMTASVQTLGKPPILELVEKCDEINGTVYAPAFGAAYTRLLQVMGDDDPASEVRGAVQELIGLIGALPKEGVTARESVYPPDAKQSSDELLKSVVAELNILIGLPSVKQEVTHLANVIKVDQIRKSQGLRCSDRSLHLVFCGNPGTGKTTVARLLATIYKALGVVSKGHLVETDRSGMVAGYVGQTAIKTRKVLEQALGGILFIDEAYSLTKGTDSNDFGREAIETLLKFMEDHRDDLIVIAAGYPNEMAEFVASNPGVQSRFTKTIQFEDYSPAELMEIFTVLCKESDYRLSEEAAATLATILQNAYDARNRSFGNARFVRNKFESAIARLANRVAMSGRTDTESLITIEKEDIQP